MIYETDEQVKSLVEAFEKCVLQAADWTHAAHLTVALWYVSDCDLETATDKMRNGIHRLNDAHGVASTPTSGYHETLTVCWMRTVGDFLEKTENQKSLASLANNLIETCGDSSLPLRFYSRALLFSIEARARFVEPDLKPF